MGRDHTINNIILSVVYLSTISTTLHLKSCLSASSDEDEARPILDVQIPCHLLQIPPSIHPLEHHHTPVYVRPRHQELVAPARHRPQVHASDLLEAREHLRHQVQAPSPYTRTGARILPPVHHTLPAPPPRSGSCAFRHSRPALELEDRDRVPALIELGPEVAVAHVDERGGELLGRGGDEDLGAGEGAIERRRGHDGNVGEEREGGVVRRGGDLLGGERRGQLVHGEEDIICAVLI